MFSSESCQIFLQIAAYSRNHDLASVICIDTINKWTGEHHSFATPIEPATNVAWSSAWSPPAPSPVRAVARPDLGHGRRRPARTGQSTSNGSRARGRTRHGPRHRRTRYRELEADGTVITRGRAGTFVADEPPHSEPLRERRERLPPPPTGSCSRSPSSGSVPTRCATPSATPSTAPPSNPRPERRSRRNAMQCPPAKGGHCSIPWREVVVLL